MRPIGTSSKTLFSEDCTTKTDSRKIEKFLYGEAENYKDKFRVISRNDLSPSPVPSGLLARGGINGQPYLLWYLRRFGLGNEVSLSKCRKEPKITQEWVVISGVE